MLRKGLHFLGASETAKRLATGTPITRTLSRRFVPGETVDSVIEAAGAANDKGLKVTMNYLGEAVLEPQGARQAAETYLELLERVRAEGLDANISVKLTQLGQDIDAGLLSELLERILDHAATRNTFVRLDMESSRYVQPTLDTFQELWDAGWRNVGVVLQAALRRTAGDARKMIDLGVRVRLCKGAYAEPPEVAFQSERKVRRSFLESMAPLMREGNYPAIASHDERIIRAARALADREGIGKGRFEFQMLYGVRRDLQDQLLAEGHPVRVYIPFGEMWYPYLMRRLAERPENFLFLVGNLVKESPLSNFWPGASPSISQDGEGKGS